LHGPQRGFVVRRALITPGSIRLALAPPTRRVQAVDLGC
jgi:hypothetical protein